MPELPIHGVTETLLPDWPADAEARRRRALDADEPDAELREVVADHPDLLPAWADLADRALDAGDRIAGYAFARVGYHRGLDAIRRAGWRGHGPVPWHHEPNRGFLRSLDALRRSALAIGEAGEPERCRDFLLQLDPDDHLDLGADGAGR